MKLSSLIFFLTISIVFLFPASTLAENYIEVKTRIVIDSAPIPTNDPDGDRIPARPIIITISMEGGVSIPGINNEDVLSYSIYDENGGLLASFTDETEFAATILSWSGIMEIRIELPEYSLCGWLEL